MLIPSKEQWGEGLDRKEDKETGLIFERFFWNLGIRAQSVAVFYYVGLIFDPQKIAPFLTPFKVHFS